MTSALSRPAATGLALEAVLWDFDGTLVNTEPMWFAAETEYMTSRGAPWPAEEARSYAGAAWTTSGQAMRDRLVEYGTDPALTAWDVYDGVTDVVVERLLSEGTPMPGVLELLERTCAAGIPNAIVSASQARLIEAGLRVLGVADMFAAVVAGPMVANGKPAPDGYLLATRMLDVRPHRCVVLEDSPTGCESGQRAGAQVIGVPSVVSLPAVAGQLRRASLEGLGVDELDRAVREHLAEPIAEGNTGG
ncbi:Phosphorylated carbohydrates phosphatase TM_1254 [Propionibacterium australiense]|uniref:Phosphoglycolate phosphatase, domain 2 n=1 Tax=Propionibacterium australiense TaxID=119981 RepID=A0A383S2M8_9ACTN|nr:HAD family phosphatase [Propionibacterium australiense]SYZ32278.1 Phosphoglycolate phosphatase, domain 2 [Propionibacterium australiense]VEH90529.1 Phosphorylated carbohydrates phosphatase TM_1254 [Propionibacterium australiense]